MVNKKINTRRKCESVLLSCTAPIIAAELRRELDKANFNSFTIEALKRKEVKIVPVVRYFVPGVGVKVKLLEFKSLQGETAVILSEYLVSVLEQNELNSFAPAKIAKKKCP